MTTNKPYVYLGTFLIAFATLVFEIVLTRLLSVITWYHLAFFAVSIAMLGMTAGATTVFLKQKWFTPDRVDDSTAKACLGFALIVPFSLLVLCLTPLNIHGSAAMSLSAVLVVTCVSMLPFYLSGIAITVVLTKYPMPIGKLYATDLAGASLGCLFVLAGLEFFDAPSLILLGGCIGVLAALSFGWRNTSLRFQILSGGVLAVLALLVLVSAVTPYGIRPVAVKGRIVDFRELLMEEWNSFSRVAVYKLAERKPQYWGESSVAPQDLLLPQHRMTIDGAAGTTLRRFASLEDIDHLRYDVTNIGYFLRQGGSAFIIGTGGGRDVQSAILFGHEKIVGIDINPIFIENLTGRFREFAGVADRDGVELIVDEARSYLSRTSDTYDIIQMSLIDTWAATGAGAFSLSENSLYTLEAWRTYFDHLKDDGIYTVSRWYNPMDLGETGRVLSLAVATLLESGVTNPADHIVLVSNKKIASLLLSRAPFSEAEIETIEKTCSEMEYSLVMHPGQPPTNEVLNSMVSTNTLQELHMAVANRALNYMPPTDDSPYFFNMLKLEHAIGFLLPSGKSASSAGQSTSPTETQGVVRGNIVASRTLIRLILALSLLSAVTIVLPLALGTGEEKGTKERKGILWSGAAYFSLIGAGFMFVEIALIQRLSVFLGHPIYALGILLFTIIISAGAGSMISEFLPLSRRPWVFGFPVTIGLVVILIRFGLPVMASSMISSPMISRILATIVLLIPLGILLGVAFPTGMRIVRKSREAETPWYWALNGVFSVLSSSVTVFVSIYFGISTSLWIGAICYFALLLCIPGMLRAANQ